MRRMVSAQQKREEEEQGQAWQASKGERMRGVRLYLLPDNSRWGMAGPWCCWMECVGRVWDGCGTAVGRVWDRARLGAMSRRENPPRSISTEWVSVSCVLVVARCGFKSSPVVAGIIP